MAKILINVTIRRIPSLGISGPSSIIRGNSAKLSAACDGVLRWDDGSTNQIRTVNTTQTTTYNAECRRFGCISSASFTVNVSGPGIFIESDKNNICPGETVRLEAKSCIGIINWTNPSVLNQISVLVNPSVNTVYSADCYINGVLSGSASFTVNVKQGASNADVSADRTAINRGETVNIFGQCSRGNLVWTGLAGGSHQLKNTTTFEAFCENNSCSGGRKSVTVTVNDIPVVNPPPPVEPPPPFKIVDSCRTIVCDPAAFPRYGSVRACEDDTLKFYTVNCPSDTVSWSNGLSGDTVCYVGRKQKINPDYHYAYCYFNGKIHSYDSVLVYVDLKPDLAIEIDTLGNLIGSEILMRGLGCMYYDSLGKLIPYGHWIYPDSLVSQILFEDPLQIRFKGAAYQKVGYWCDYVCPSDTVFKEIRLRKPVLKDVDGTVSNKEICFGEKVEIKTSCQNIAVFHNSDTLYLGGSVFSFEFSQKDSMTVVLSCFEKVGEKDVSPVYFGKKQTILIFSSLPNLGSLKIYPNPFKEYITASTEGCLDQLEIQLYDIEGRKVNKNMAFEYFNDGLRFSTTDLPSGDYVALIYYKGRKIDSKVIIKQN